MDIRFCLMWFSSRQSLSRNFKQSGSALLFSDYVSRISKFTPCHVSGQSSITETGKKGVSLWVCDRGIKSKELTSEELADRLEKVRDSGVRELQIAIGGADGFSEQDLERLDPDFRWSFGPLTLPHELAAVVASEQIYRAWTIIRKLPYHQGH